MEDIYQFAFILLSSVGGAAIIIASLSGWLGKVWANRILETDKAKYVRELDKIRHKFQIERNQLSIIHENQKSSFQQIINILQKSIKSLEQEYDEEWYPINNKPYDELKQVIIEESLFLSHEAEQALNIYLTFLSRAISFPDDPPLEDKQLRNIYEHLTYISERIREYFRKRICLSTEPNPLLEVNMLAACLLINDYSFARKKSSKKLVLQFSFNCSPQALISKMKEDNNNLISELNKLIHYFEIDSDKRSTYFRIISEARYYIKIIEIA